MVVAESSTNYTSWKKHSFTRTEQDYTMAEPLGLIDWTPVRSGDFWDDSSLLSRTLFKACHDRCTVGHVHFSKNALASCTVSKHAHSSTDSSCIVRTTVNTGQTHQVITALKVCILLFVWNVHQEISGSETPLNTNRIKYNFVCVCFDLCKF